MADSRSQSFFILGLGGPESFRSKTDNGISTQNMQARAQRFWRKFSDFQQQANSAPLPFGKGEGFTSQALKARNQPHPVLSLAEGEPTHRAQAQRAFARRIRFSCFSAPG